MPAVCFEPMIVPFHHTTSASRTTERPSARSLPRHDSGMSTVWRNHTSPSKSFSSARPASSHGFGTAMSNQSLVSRFGSEAYFFAALAGSAFAVHCSTARKNSKSAPKKAFVWSSSANRSRKSKGISRRNASPLTQASAAVAPAEL